jgi:hypothetical protein
MSPKVSQQFHFYVPLVEEMHNEKNYFKFRKRLKRNGFLFLAVIININKYDNTENLQPAVGGRHCEFM